MTTFPSPFRISSPADILSYVPHALGFVPFESLVILTLTGKRLGATLRVDLPYGDGDPAQFAAGVCSFLVADDTADGSLMMLYTATPWDRPGAPPHRSMVNALDSALHRAGIGLRDGWLISPSTWRDYFCSDAQCCLWPGHPLEGVTDSALNAELIFEGSSVAPSVDAAVQLGAAAPAPQATAEVARACAKYAALCRGRWLETSQFRATVEVWEAAISLPLPLECSEQPGVGGFLIASLGSKTVRDFLLVSSCLGLGSAVRGARACGLLEEQHPAAPPVAPALTHPLRPAGNSGSDAASWDAPASRADALQLSDLLSGRYEGAMTWSRADSVHDLLIRLSAVSAGEGKAAVCSMLAWIEFARGRGSRACVHLAEAEAAAPGYRLARLLSELISRGGMPAWARKRSSAWAAPSRRTG
ncbi:DUF4192 domain-containing protein [Arthrobacter sp. Br18]|uniref:DUF4192 domain-containing protein n=1 Tax=Arthrobacter sp. Br18 TaxID=1312954 RepID=UPI00047DF4B9|nr:DUF4192 domain-containing protein [Arthrobacter sp. Br18]